MTCFVLAYQLADGAENMALDEAILDWVAERDDSACLRTYGWSVPTLSLGYFQSLAAARADPRWASVPIVRRPTGGGAIWHEHELTYAVVLPAKHPMARSRTDLYRVVHGQIAEILREFGGRTAAEAAPGNPAGVTSGQQTEQKRPLLCFTDRNAHDIVIGGFKVAGSAQRRRAGAVLQHGSLLVDLSDRTPELRGVRNVADIALEVREWSDRLIERIPGCLGLSAIVAAVPDQVRKRAAELEETVYRSPRWTGLRP
jgi:lipoate-protein ligase A